MAEESMYDGKGRVDRATVTWRAMVLILLAVLGVLSGRILIQIDKTADLAISLQHLVGTLGSRIDAHKDRLADHDKAIYRLEDEVFVKARRP